MLLKNRNNHRRFNKEVGDLPESIGNFLITARLLIASSEKITHFYLNRAVFNAEVVMEFHTNSG
jgi:hypothetical protein